ncbi:MAG: amidohydrolase [Chloroflexi bacterium]|nr:amidohydrolase [Chloroflexota bacterium]
MVIDSHCHILPPSFTERRAELAVSDASFASILADPKAVLATAETLVRDMDRDGVSRSVVMGMGWADLAVAREANDYIMESVERFSDRLLGFCSVNPAWGDAAISEVERCAAAGVRGIGELHPDTQGFDITGKAIMAPLMDTALRLGLPVLVHASEPAGHQYPGKGRTTPGKLYRFIENFPGNTIICAHWGGGLPFYALMPEVPAIIENVYFDTAASPFLYKPEVFAAVAGLVGANKILFASDYPLIPPRRLLAQLEEAGLDEADRDAILAGNASRLFGL